MWSIMQCLLKKVCSPPYLLNIRLERFFSSFLLLYCLHIILQLHLSLSIYIFNEKSVAKISIVKDNILSDMCVSINICSFNWTSSRPAL
jgi:hypothetical protein